jgi:hypothetical protein
MRAAATRLVAAMTSRLVRLFALAGTILLFFVAWAVIAAHPWKAEPVAATDPRLVQLAAREKRLRHEAVVVRRTVDHRWAVYRRKLKARRQEIVAAKHQAQVIAAQQPAAPARIVTLPPLTVTRTS